MSENAEQQARNVLANLPTLLPDLESVYKDIQSHPELSMQEKRTAGIAADRLRTAGYEVTTQCGQDRSSRHTPQRRRPNHHAPS